MNQHIIDFLIFHFNRHEDRKVWICMKPEFTGYERTNWRAEFYMAEINQNQIKAKLFYYRKEAYCHKEEE